MDSQPEERTMVPCKARKGIRVFVTVFEASLLTRRKRCRNFSIYGSQATQDLHLLP
jgi:hypothetical protein